MAVVPCYRGPIPVTDDERIGIWRWAKENAIDKGMPIEQVRDAINQKFFAGVARPEWLNDILSGRKTPFRELTNDVWRKQYQRRQIIKAATNDLRSMTMGPIGRTLSSIWDIPRGIATFGHGVVFPITHAGDLLLRPLSWNTFFRGFFRTYGGTFDKAFAARAMADMESRALFTDALRSGLDVKSDSRPGNLITSRFPGQAMSERAWDMLKIMRYQLWEGQMQKLVKPDMSVEEIQDLGKNLAAWANHATGSSQVPLTGKLGKVYSSLAFGPKLTASKVSRLIGDPYETIKTFSNWKDATPGEKAAARIRLSGATQYAVTLLGSLAVNQGLNMALHSGQNVNFKDPTKGDWLKFKVGGLELGIPGLHSELRTLGQIMATAFGPPEQWHKTRQERLIEIGGQYVTSKLTPAGQIAKELLTREDWRGRPLPWAGEKAGKKPGPDWYQYALQKLPIPMTGPIGYVYDKFKAGGMSALDASTMIKGLILFGLGATGLHVQEEPAPPPPKRGVNQPVGARR